MLDSPDTTRGRSRSTDSDADSSTDWYVKQWLQLCKLLEVSDPDAALEHVRTLKERSDSSASSVDASPDNADAPQQKLDEAGLSSVDEALAKIRDLEDKCDRLASESDDASRASSSKEDADALPSSPVSDVLGIRSRLASQMTLSLAEETESMLREQVAQQVPEPTLSASPDDILSTMRSLRDCAEALRTVPATDDAPDAPAEIETLTGVAGVEDARELDQAVRRLHTYLAETIPEVDLPTGTEDETARSTIKYLADQMADHSSAGTPRGDGMPAPPDSDVESDRSAAPPSWVETPPVSTGDGSPVPSSSPLERTVCSMQAQLESLYAEKEALLRIGVEDGREAAGRIDELEARVTVLQHQNEEQRQLLQRLKDTIGTLDVAEIAQMKTSAVNVDATRSDPASSSEPAAPKADTTTDSTRPLPDSTLRRLDQMTDEALNDLSVGALRLGDEGTIEYANDAALQLPGLDDDRSSLQGASLFQLVPSTSNTLFLNPFREGVEAGRMDTCFPYTFVSPNAAPAAFVVHLYRAGPSKANWLLIERA